MSAVHEMPPLVRVFVPTYRRQTLLLRALESLRAQSFTDWVCEIHNDDPADCFPDQFVNVIRDPRIVVRNHQRNLGSSATFNLFYHPTSEPFYSLLEDDNWWEPQFLDRMIYELKVHPNVTMAWCNQKIWEELPDQSWRDTGEFANPPEEGASRLVWFGNLEQMMGAIHANGAMLLRSSGKTYTTPRDCPFTWVEASRERMIPHPLLYVPQALAVFGRTRQTARSLNRAEWVVGVTMLSATFLKHANFSDADLENATAEARRDRPPNTNALLLAALVEPACSKLLRYSKLRDWLLLLRSIVRRPNVLWRVIRARRLHPDWWQFLEYHTAARFAESRSRSEGASYTRTLKI
jgi:glycosyltransferase involved in cell wall biosynthesis